MADNQLICKGMSYDKYTTAEEYDDICVLAGSPVAHKFSASQIEQRYEKLYNSTISDCNFTKFTTDHLANENFINKILYFYDKKYNKI